MKGRLLLVEDEEEARCSLVRTLERQGYACLTAATYEEAAAVLARETVPIDAAVVDIVLGDDDRGGLRVLPLIRALPGKPRVVVITAFADVSRVKEALNGGAAFLLEKPFRATDLIEILGRLLDESELGNYVDRALSRARLTDKETEVARLLLKGLTSQEIARLAANSEKTIRQHVSQVYAKCGVSSRAEFFHFVFPS